MKSRIYALLEVIFIVLFLFSAYKLVTIYKDYSEGDKIYEESADSYFEVPENDSDSGDKKLKLDIKSLKETNPDTIGWIYIEDTPISYPVLQNDNNTYYLKHAYNNKYSGFGSIFIDYRCNGDLTDKNTLIYGHNTKNGSMFGSLKKYKNADYLKKHPYIYIVCENKTYKYQIFSIYTTDTSDKSYTLDFASAADFRKWISYVDSNSLIDVMGNYKPTGKENVITLSTCVKHNSPERFVVFAIQTDIIENTDSIEIKK